MSDSENRKSKIEMRIRAASASSSSLRDETVALTFDATEFDGLVQRMQKCETKDARIEEFKTTMQRYGIVYLPAPSVGREACRDDAATTVGATESTSTAPPPSTAKPLLSFKHVRSETELECMLAAFAKRYDRDCDCPNPMNKCEHDLPPTPRKYMERVASVAWGQIDDMTSPQKFIEVTSDSRLMKNSSIIARIHGLQQAIKKNARAAEWNTEDGTPNTDWKDNDWVHSSPSYAIRVRHALEVMSSTQFNQQQMSVPSPADMLMYRRSKDGKGWDGFAAMDKRERANKANVEPAAHVLDADVPRWIRVLGPVWEYLCGAPSECDPWDHDSVYLLAISDPNAPSGFAGQIYAGSAASSVKKRWFGKGVTSHLQQIVTIIKSAKAGTLGSASGSPLLVDATLAQMWLSKGTWKGDAMLFVVACSLGKKGDAEYQDVLVDRFHLTHAVSGMNDKKSGQKPTAAPTSQSH